MRRSITGAYLQKADQLVRLRDEADRMDEECETYSREAFIACCRARTVEVSTGRVVDPLRDIGVGIVSDAANLLLMGDFEQASGVAWIRVGDYGFEVPLED